MNGLYDFGSSLECGLRVLLRMYQDHKQVPAPSIRCLAMH